MDGDSVASAPNGWSGLRAITALHSLNARCIAMLAAAARGEKVGAEFSRIYWESHLWRQVDQRACERAGQCPMLLLNLNFEKLDWWKRVCEESSAGSPPVGDVILVQDSQASGLLREILMEVWRLGDASPREANLLFGMAPGVSAAIANLAASSIDRIAADYAATLRPRWEENGVFWRNLLQAAIGFDDEALFNVHLHCWQLLGGDLDERSI